MRSLLACFALLNSSSLRPDTTKFEYEISKSARRRPAFASPRSIAGSVTCSMKGSVLNGWMIMPSATSPATSVMCGPTAARMTFGAPYCLFSGVNAGVISVWL